MSDADKPFFTNEEVSHIEKNLGFLVFNWSDSLISHVIDRAMEAKVEKLYMNTPSTLHGGANDGKVSFLYERLPLSMGFKKVQANLRGKKESFWMLKLDKVENESVEAETEVAKPTSIDPTAIPLEVIPRNYQGAVINILGKRETYTKDELMKVLEVLKREQEKKGKAVARFFYGWDKTWNGGQAFFEGTDKSSRNDTVVIQKIPSEMQEFMANDPILAKFFSFILGTSKHFQQDVLSFILVNKIDTKKWVINEIQTDCINHYMKERNKLRKMAMSKDKKPDWSQIKDMLEANGKKKWIAKLDSMPELKEQVLNNPNLINEFCDDSQNIDKWIKEYNERNERAMEEAEA